MSMYYSPEWNIYIRVIALLLNKPRVTSCQTHFELIFPLRKHRSTSHDLVKTLDSLRSTQLFTQPTNSNITTRLLNIIKTLFKGQI